MASRRIAFYFIVARAGKRACCLQGSVMAKEKIKSNADRDLDLILKAQAGDMQARDQLIQYWWPTIRYRAARRVFGDNINDASQVVVIRLLGAIDRYRRESGTVSTFLTGQIDGAVADFLRELVPSGCRRPKGIASREEAMAVFQKTASIDQVQGTSGQQWTILQDYADEGCEYDRQVLEDEDSFDRLLLSLSEPMRTMIDLRFRYDWTFVDIAKQVGCSQCYVAMRIRDELPILGERLRRMADGELMQTAVEA
jgi:RNA polymerase sigma factor (sigma-70 family)